MRPLPPNIKTALIFYSVFALLLLLVNGWAATSVASTAGRENESFVFRRPGTVDLVFLQDGLEESWANLVAEKGLNPNAIMQLVDARLMIKNYPRNEVRWVQYQCRIVLPKAVDETAVVDLGWEWRKLVLAQGLSVRKISWGLAKQTLWVKLESEARVELAGQTVTLPCGEMSISQPLANAVQRRWNWRGLIPEPLPVLKPITNDNGRKPSDKLNVQAPPPANPKAKIVPPKLPPIKRRARVAIVIDDVGFVRAPADAMLKVQAPLTWSVLPSTPFAGEYIAAAREHGFEIILHLPLEPIDKSNNPGPGLIKAEWPEEKILEQLDQDLGEVPGAVGLNNHMGSAATHDSRLMDILMRAIKKKRLFFLDSNTGDGAHPSVAGKYARLYQVPFAKRQVFIDNLSDIGSKKEKLHELIQIALADGQAIGIGHVRDGTAQAIIEMLPEFVKAGVEIVPLSKLVR